MANGTDDKTILCAPCGSTGLHGAARHEVADLSRPPETEEEARDQILTYMRRRDKTMRTLADS
jgi:hypothetical protein